MAIKRGRRTVVVHNKGTVNEYGDGVAWIRGPMIGKGSFGRVHKATLKNPTSQYCSFLPSEMAVKSAEVSVSDTLRKERETMRKLKGCPYIIQCLGEETSIGDNGVMAYNLLLEYASGGTLADRIMKSGGGLPELEVRVHTRSLLRGLYHIHQHGYVHCDLKPENILLVPSCGRGHGVTAKIGDFGLSRKRQTSSTKKRKLMEDAVVFYWRGTPMYLSPEAVMDYVQEAPCDIWALGCIVLEMLTGKRPWEGEQQEEILRRIGADEELIPKIPKEVSEVARHFLMCCFERNPMCRLNCELLLDHPFVEEVYDGDDDEELEDSFSCDHHDGDSLISSCSSSNSIN